MLPTRSSFRASPPQQAPPRDAISSKMLFALMAPGNGFLVEDPATHNRLVALANNGVDFIFLALCPERLLLPKLWQARDHTQGLYFSRGPASGSGSPAANSSLTGRPSRTLCQTCLMALCGPQIQFQQSLIGVTSRHPPHLGIGAVPQHSVLVQHALPNTLPEAASATPSPRKRKRQTPPGPWPRHHDLP
jgi:hypothetical protein